MKPFSPAEAIERKNQLIPVEVVRACNELIAENLIVNGQNGKCHAIVLIEDLLDRAKSLMMAAENPQHHEDFFRKRWLDVEPMFRDSGWKVTFDKPGYSESYKARLIFESL